MSAETNNIADGHRVRRDFYEREWLKASERSAQLHDRYMQAERELIRAELRRLPVMTPPIKIELVEDEA